MDELQGTGKKDIRRTGAQAWELWEVLILPYTGSDGSLGSRPRPPPFQRALAGPRDATHRGGWIDGCRAGLVLKNGAGWASGGEEWKGLNGGVFNTLYHILICLDTLFFTQMQISGPSHTKYQRSHLTRVQNGGRHAHACLTFTVSAEPGHPSSAYSSLALPLPAEVWAFYTERMKIYKHARHVQNSIYIYVYSI